MAVQMADFKHMHENWCLHCLYCQLGMLKAARASAASFSIIYCNLANDKQTPGEVMGPQSAEAQKRRSTDMDAGARQANGQKCCGEGLQQMNKQTNTP